MPKNSTDDKSKNKILTKRRLRPADEFINDLKSKLHTKQINKHATQKPLLSIDSSSEL